MERVTKHTRRGPPGQKGTEDRVPGDGGLPSKSMLRDTYYFLYGDLNTREKNIAKAKLNYT